MKRIDRLNFKDGQIFNQLKGIKSFNETLDYFIKRQKELSDYGYWSILAALWGNRMTEGDTPWKLLFSENRNMKQEWIMLNLEDRLGYRQLPSHLSVYQIESDKENIAYTPNLNTAKMLVKEKKRQNNDKIIIKEFSVRKKHILAYFKKKDEVIILDERHLNFKRTHIMLNEDMYLAPHFKGDVGIICMPSVKSIPIPKNKSWKKVRCSICNEECWENPLIKEQSETEKLSKMCTNCAMVMASQNLIK